MWGSIRSRHHSETAFSPDNSTTPWLAGLRLDSFPGPSLAQQVAQAAHSIGADILSPSASSFETPAADPQMEGYVEFTTKEMIDTAHKLGLQVKPYTVNRMNIVDNRIHACVFFIQPTGHSLKPLDIEVMKRLHTKVNLIPVIAKSDTLTDEEITAFKARVSLQDLFS